MFMHNNRETRISDAGESSQKNKGRGYALDLIRQQADSLTERDISEKYKSFKEKHVRSDMNTMIKDLLANYPENQRYSMIKLHTKLLDAPKDIQRAFAVVRGMDLYEKIKRTPIEDMSEAYHKRYKTFSNDDDDYSTWTMVKGYNRHCYKNTIDLEQGTIRFEENYKSRPKDNQGNFRAGNIDDEVEPFQVNQYGVEKAIKGTKPLSNTDIIYHQILHEAKQQDFNIAKFKLQKMKGIDIQNVEALRTMSLFVERGETKTFKLGDLEYYAGIATPGGNSKWRLLQYLDPNLIIPEYKVKRSSTGSLIDSLEIEYYVSPS